jgi:hypothetical protein
LLDGKGVDVDAAQAVAYFKRPTRQHNLTARINLGFCLHQGIGIQLNRLKSVKYFKETADQGNAVGQFNYALCCYLGKGILNDFTEACDDFRLSADQCFMPDRRPTTSSPVNHCINCGDLSSVALYAEPGCDLSETEKGEENWREYRRFSWGLRLKAIDWGKLTKFQNSSVSQTLNIVGER